MEMGYENLTLRIIPLNSGASGEHPSSCSSRDWLDGRCGHSAILFDVYFLLGPDD